MSKLQLGTVERDIEGSNKLRISYL